jgi:hypothetical protein
MRCIDPGHAYVLEQYDGQTYRPYLIFMKRFGPGYPFNTGSHPGTNCQDVHRVLIDRVKYLQLQVPSFWNTLIIWANRFALWSFEMRAMRRHRLGWWISPWQIEQRAFCEVCGHIVCRGGHYELENQRP